MGTEVVCQWCSHETHSGQHCAVIVMSLEGVPGWCPCDGLPENVTSLPAPFGDLEGQT